MFVQSQARDVKEYRYTPIPTDQRKNSKGEEIPKKKSLWIRNEAGVKFHQKLQKGERGWIEEKILWDVKSKNLYL